MWNLVTDPTIPLETKKKPTQKLGTSQRISYRKLVADLRFRHLSIDTPTGSHALTGALADTTSVFMPQMRAQHVAFAGLAVWLKLSVFTSSALALRTAVQAV